MNDDRCYDECYDERWRCMEPVLECYGGGTPCGDLPVRMFVERGRRGPYVSGFCGMHAERALDRGLTELTEEEADDLETVTDVHRT